MSLRARAAGRPGAAALQAREGTARIAGVLSKGGAATWIALVGPGPCASRKGRMTGCVSVCTGAGPIRAAPPFRALTIRNGRPAGSAGRRSGFRMTPNGAAVKDDSRFSPTRL